jgi:hypothetical protein
MTMLKTVKYTFMLFLVLAVLVFPVGADPVGTITSNNVTNSNTGNAMPTVSPTDSSSGIDANKIYSNQYILGFPRGNGNIGDLINVKNSIAVISSSDIVWAIVSLFFAIVIAIIIIGFLGAHGLNGLKMVKATLFNDNAEEAVQHIHKAKKSSLTLTYGIGTIVLIVVGFVFLLSLIH